jgi:D-sedoheptulose 7-phosphate isomerase
MQDRIHKLFESSIETKITSADTLSPWIAKAGSRLINCLLNDGKILLCGQGGSAASCQHFAATMVHHFEVERPALPVMTLMHDNQHDALFAKQIQALGQAGDVLVMLTTSGNAPSLIQALAAARDKKMDIIVLSGRDGGALTAHSQADDIEIRVTVNNTARIREMHLFILHCFCDLIEQSLFGQMLE